ncbi:RING-CH-type domain-containing protein [Favolaschia claudopus]|uniref:RING-CH-type domain-containing protein n=1 Tax=Favolaschia claudopus TaxID=2862362 RepID=A0AAW0EHX5_9AGAR
MPPDDRQCRICLAGVEETSLGRLIKPCLCKGSISFVHVKCLQRWRNSSASQSAFFSCPQCHYKYRFARTQIVGIATNPVVVASISTILFTALVILSSFITTFFYSDEPADNYYYRSSFFGYGGFFFVSPFDVARDIVRAGLRILQDTDSQVFGHGDVPSDASTPLIGGGSIVHMLLSAPLLSPLQFLARYRSNSRRRESSRDIASLIIVGLILLGAVRALIKVYDFTQSVTKRILLRAEDAILEV